MPVYKRVGIWYYRFQIRGVRYARAVPEATTKRQAEQSETQARQRVFEGKYEGEQNSIKLSEFVERHYLPWAKAEKRSWRNDVSRIKPILVYFGRKQMREVSSFNVRQFRKERLASKNGRGGVRAPASVDRELQLLSRIFSLAIEHGYLNANPCKSVPLCNPDNSVAHYLSDEEEAKLISVLTGRRSHLYDILTIDQHTGMRKTELLSLNKSQIDFLRDRIILTNTKNGKPRSIPIHDDIRDCLRRRCEQAGPSGYLFEYRKTGKPLRDIKSAWRTALKLAGIPHITFHCAGRHTFGTRAAAGGANLADIQSIMDHADIRTTMRYVHATEAGKLRAINAAVRGRSGTNVVQAIEAAR